MHRFKDLHPVDLKQVAAIATVAVLAVALGASWFPARRAARIEAAATLRRE
jgi:ABC-type lipoprotein release transport system permease subunit